MPTQNGPGCRGLTEKPSCLWGRSLWAEGVGSRKAVLTSMWPAHPVRSQTVLCPTGLGSYREGSTWGLDIEVMFWMCQALGEV